MTDRYKNILKAIGILILTVIAVCIITSGYVVLMYAQRIEREVYIGGI
jgi:hypothetical protein